MKFIPISKAILLLLFLSLAVLASAQTMTIKGRHLYTAAGEKVILRGINEMFIWSNDKTGETILPEIAKTGANSCRLAWTTAGAPDEMDRLIANCIRYKMIPIIELHDATGDWSKLQICLDYWKRADVKAVMDKHKKWVLLNIANEVGGKTPADTFRVKYTNAVQQLRTAGYEVPLLIDAANWGQDETSVLATWKDIVQADPKKQCMFSVHTYWSQNAQDRLNSLINRVVKEEIPLLFGEAPQPKVGPNCSVDFPYTSFLSQCQEKEIGWLVWSWGAVNNGDCGRPNSPYDITTDGKYGNWEHAWNREVVEEHAGSIQKTSIRPNSLVKENKNKKQKSS
ncbi:cellulase family glycosylhydrolase [Adhaeribacter aquaticus]|uniref:cellulase family glycosylhydrolase n=1 Tax=Adhaeribacter aquaticus TaxID=299567 RepID=UPI000402FC77|nr:cellulase family glycosylhydrolase [Adhaeribacter aquaticus]